MRYTTIIKNGTLFDGTNNPPIKADVAIRKDKIIKIGELQKERAELIIDAKNFYIAPGFIDLTTHSDNHWTIFSHPNQESFIKQGVTTILGGHGGFSLAPIIKKEAMQSLGKWIDLTEININWRSTKEFLNELENHKIALNFATLVGHETLRRNILHDKKNIKEINSLLERALEEGAFGLSTSFSAPSAQTIPEEEISTLLQTIRKYDCFSSHHFKNEGKGLLPSVSRLITLLRKTMSKGHIAHFKALGRKAWQEFENALNMIDLARKEEIILTSDFFPYTSTGSNLTSLLPNWLLSENEKKIIELLKQKETQQNVTEHLKNLTLHYDKVTIATAGRGPSSIGKTIKEISSASELSEEEIVINLLLANNLRVAIFNQVISEKNIEALSKKDHSAISSDGVGYEIQKISTLERKNDLPHPRSFGAFPKAFSGLVKEKNILKWEEIIHKMTGLPAKILGLEKRGLIKENYYADIAVIDPATIKDKSTYGEPFKYSEGVKYVFVNGELTLAEGTLKETPAGKVLRRK